MAFLNYRNSVQLHLQIVLVTVLCCSFVGLPTTSQALDLNIQELKFSTLVKPAAQSFGDKLKKGEHNFEKGASIISRTLTFRHRKHSTLPPLCIPRSECPDQHSNHTSVPLCSLPVGELPSGRPHPGNTHHAFLPTWINLTLARQGQAFARKNRCSVAIAGGFGVVIGLASPDSRDLLAFTRNSDTVETAARRYIATSAQMYVWFDELFSGDQDDNVILESISNVRTMHKRAVKSASASPQPLVPPDTYSKVETDDDMWDAVLKDLNESPLVKYKDWPANYSKYDSMATPMNQFIQGVTAWGFMGYLMMDPESVYIWDATEGELRAFLHLWAVILYMMGVEDQYNAALQPTVAAAAQMILDCQNMYSLPGFFRMEKTTRVMMESLAIGLDAKGTNFGLRRVMYMILRDLFKIPAHHTRAVFSPADELAQLYWDEVFVPSTRLPGSRVLINRGFEAGFNSVRAGMFGMHDSQGEIAKHVFYPSAPGGATVSEQQADITHSH